MIDLILPAGIGQPLVSLIVINYNYARFIGATIDSIKAQSYPLIECLIVDNKSTDESLEIIAEHVGDDPRFKVFSLPENLGQLGAFLHILKEAQGSFVTIVDSDDVLFSDFVSTHVQAHLALPRSVAFTSSNLIEIDAESRMIAGRSSLFGQGQEDLPRLLSSIDTIPRLAEVPDEEYQRLSEVTVTVPANRYGWFWGPGTSNMYRRSVLALIHQESGRYMRPVDSYLNPLCHALGGSALIDRQLSAYRLHGGNLFVAHESIRGLRTGRGGADLLIEKERRESIELVLRKAEHFVGLVGKSRFWTLIDQLSNDPTRSALSHPELRTAFAENLKSLMNVFGEKETYDDLFRRFRSRPLRAVLRQAHHGHLPLRLRAAIFARSAQRRIEQKRRGKSSPPASAPPQAQSSLRSVEGGVDRKPPAHQVVYSQHIGFGPLAVLSYNPPVFLTGIAYLDFLGVAPAFGRWYGDVPAGFIVYPTWTIEEKKKAALLAAAAEAHRRKFSRHRFVFMTNTQREANLLTRAGINAIFLNKNFLVSEKDFCPLPGTALDFDAIYNARFIGFKRHQLADKIERVAYVSYAEGTPAEQDLQKVQMAAILERNPRHTLVNPTDGGLPVHIPPSEVNLALNRAAVGLCLSAIEGANYASMEYMLAGLPVVSTPSTGGRDVYFDPEYCIICNPDAAAVAAAVEEMKARAIPRSHIRARTLARIEPMREKFLALVDELTAQLGGTERLKRPWPYSGSGMASWNTFETHLTDFDRSHDAGGSLAERLRQAEAWMDELKDVQLQPSELRPIVEAIVSRPQCSLLVFGCGNDSTFWENVNEGGTTAFLEGDAAWQARVQPTLAKAQAHLVDYGTQARDWVSLLHSPGSLWMDLPDAVSGHRWDVILVDGPPGYEESQPGRMRSIYMASKLVAPGGIVFVHDCERIVEREYAGVYLGNQRLCVQAKGRALLNGYAF